ncbi:hypothetical protein Lal_00018470 [Lupinus albus]|nr:hypothetical protein Lal_00018470 [Lupinus albus]
MILKLEAVSVELEKLPRTKPNTHQGENPSLKRRHHRPGETCLSILKDSRPGETFSPLRENLAQARNSRSSEKAQNLFLKRGRTKLVADKGHPPPKKHRSDTSGQATPSYNRNKFTSLEREERYNTLLQWAFVPERRVDFQRNEYPNFLTRLDALKWVTIASPHDKFDPDVVREFYANAYPPEEGG